MLTVFVNSVKVNGPRNVELFVISILDPIDFHCMN